MARLLFVRHGKSALSFDCAMDSPLSDAGLDQARRCAAGIDGLTAPCRIVSSPLLRARQTAECLAERWGGGIAIEPAVAEIPVPLPLTPDHPQERRRWLNGILADRYGALSHEVERWRRELLDFVRRQTSDSVIFSHYLTINAVVGAGQGDGRTVVVDPDYCEVVEVLVRDGQIQLPGRAP